MPWCRERRQISASSRQPIRYLHPDSGEKIKIIKNKKGGGCRIVQFWRGGGGVLKRQIERYLYVPCEHIRERHDSLRMNSVLNDSRPYFRAMFFAPETRKINTNAAYATIYM